MRLFLLGLALFGACCGAMAADRPNLVFFITDDQSWLDCGAYGSRYVRTPNFDRVAKEGALFRHAYVSSPSCTPSRAAILTGRNFWELEEGAMLHGPLPAKFPVLPDLLEARGYKVGFTGKGWGPGLFQDGGRGRNPAGPEFNSVRLEPKPDPELSPIDYAGNLKAFLKERRGGEPFFFWVGTFEPHHPHNRNNHEKMPFPYAEMDVPPFVHPGGGAKRARADYFFEIEYADKRLGEVLAALEAAGESGNTLIMVTADNGTPIPRAKGNLYDWGTRVPLAAMWPGKIKGGRSVDDMINLQDCAPTYLAAAGAPVPPEMTARSFLEVLLAEKSGQVDPARDWVTAGLEWHDSAYPMRMIRTPRYMYVRNYTDLPRRARHAPAELPDDQFGKYVAQRDYGAMLRMFPEHPAIKPYLDLCYAPRPREELYDVNADPCQLTNLAGRAELGAVRGELSEKLTAWQKQTGDPRETGRAAFFEAQVVERERARDARKKE